MSKQYSIGSVVFWKDGTYWPLVGDERVAMLQTAFDRKPLPEGVEMRADHYNFNAPLSWEDVRWDTFKRVDPMVALAAELELAHEAAEASQEVVVGAVRGLLECAAGGDSESVNLLRRMSAQVDDDALRDALALFFQAQEKHHEVSARVRAHISKQEG